MLDAEHGMHLDDNAIASAVIEAGLAVDGHVDTKR